MVFLHGGRYIISLGVPIASRWSSLARQGSKAMDGLAISFSRDPSARSFRMTRAGEAPALGRSCREPACTLESCDDSPLSHAPFVLRLAAFASL
jgi:hypothetical protein